MHGSSSLKMINEQSRSHIDSACFVHFDNFDNSFYSRLAGVLKYKQQRSFNAIINTSRTIQVCIQTGLCD